MKKICLFAGTTEGRKLTEYLNAGDAQVVVCVATEYGEELLDKSENVTVSARRLTKDQILEMFRKEQFDLVIDATHPYAEAVTKSIREACAETNTVYERLLRKSSSGSENAVFVRDTKEAADYLSGTEGNILLTTGSKGLEDFTSIPDFAERIYARVLPMESSLLSCRQAGLKPSHIIAMQGPFTEEINTALLNCLSASWIVTKDGGEAGGFKEKEEAAEKTGARMLVIGRPQEEEGRSYEEMLLLLQQVYGFARTCEVKIVGIGPGRKDAMTKEVAEAIRKAECLIGARRMLKDAGRPGQQIFEAVSPDSIVHYMEEHPQFCRFAVLMSGDSGFFSGTRKLLKTLEASQTTFHTEVLPGISSLSYLCSRIQVSYEDALTVSLHGRERDIAADVRSHGKVFALVGGGNGINKLCKALVDAGLGNVKITIGERLSYPDEKISVGLARELVSGIYDPLSAAFIENEHAKEQPDPVPAEIKTVGIENAPSAGSQAEGEVLPVPASENAAPETLEGDYSRIVTHGIPDQAFERGSGQQGMIPMTKREIRSISLSRLQLTKAAVCWDIGTGTGSVAIEMARQASDGRVYAVDKEPEAVRLTKENVSRLGVSNVTVVEGPAPEVLKDLPAPTHVFIGGSSGNIREITACILSRNPDAVIVATAVTLDTIAELTSLIRESAFAESEVTAVNVSNDRKAGSYRLMSALNPVYIFTIRRKDG